MHARDERRCASPSLALGAKSAGNRCVVRRDRSPTARPAQAGSGSHDLRRGPLALSSEMSGYLVGSAAFKAVGTGDPRPAGSIPVHLRQWVHERPIYIPDDGAGGEECSYFVSDSQMFDDSQPLIAVSVTVYPFDETRV